VLFAQYYIECLSQASYLVGDPAAGEAVVVDPRRDVAEYLADARAAGVRIVGIINTHFHADFVSGHLELAEATGAWIGYGEAAAVEFPVRHLRDGERLTLGDVVLEIMATPGHTPESISVVVWEHAGDEIPYGVLTGDALFIGDVGRPDLLASLGASAEQLGAQLHDSIQHRLMSLPDPVRVFPAHGAGSACGKNLSIERSSTIGEQRRDNYACRPMSEPEFVALVSADQPAAPPYFLFDAMLNRHNREQRRLDATIAPLDDAAIAAALAAGAVVLDTRPPAEFATGHLVGALNVGADGRLAETAGMVLDAEDRVIVMAPPGLEQEVALRLARIGFDRVVGYVPAPEAWLGDRPVGETERSSRLTVADLDAAVAGGNLQLVDLRNPGERAAGALPGAIEIPLAELSRRGDELDLAAPIVVYCAGGWRSSAGASLLRRRGARDVSDLLGGYEAWAGSHGPTV
jgi:glyoxylase-like metal-dependent hydrolase (beta-lactamase superfamily II)/rhodanese-related sulfurtransferase